MGLAKWIIYDTCLVKLSILEPGIVSQTDHHLLERICDTNFLDDKLQHIFEPGHEKEALQLRQGRQEVQEEQWYLLECTWAVQTRYCW